MKVTSTPSTSLLWGYEAGMLVEHAAFASGEGIGVGLGTSVVPFLRGCELLDQDGEVSAFLANYVEVTVLWDDGSIGEYEVESPWAGRPEECDPAPPPTIRRLATRKWVTWYGPVGGPPVDEAVVRWLSVCSVGESG